MDYEQFRNRSKESTDFENVGIAQWLRYSAPTHLPRF